MTVTCLAFSGVIAASDVDQWSDRVARIGPRRWVERHDHRQRQRHAHDRFERWRLFRIHRTPSMTAWQPGIAVEVGERFTFGGATWECLQAHTTQQGWEPPTTPSLWRAA